MGGGEQIRSINKQKEKVHCKLMCLTWGRCIGGRISLKGTFFPIQASGLRQIRVARGSKMGAVCGIRGVAAVRDQNFKQKKKVVRRVAGQVYYCLDNNKHVRRWVGGSDEGSTAPSSSLVCGLNFGFS